MIVFLARIPGLYACITGGILMRISAFFKCTAAVGVFCCTILFSASGVNAADIYDSVQSLQGNFAEVTKNGKTFFVDLASGRVYDSVESYAGKPDILIIGRNGTFGVARDDGKILVNPEYDEIQLYPDGYISVKKGKYYGRFLSSGEPAIPCAYDSISIPFGFTLLERDGKYGWYSPVKGKIVFPAATEKVSDFYKTADFVETVKDGLHGIMSIDGSIVFEPVYEKIEYFDADVFGVRKNGRWGLVKGDGKILCESRFETFVPGYYGYAVVSEKGKYGYVNLDGKIAVPLSYDEADLFEMFLGKVTRKGKEGVVNTDGKEIVPCIYSSAHISQYPEFDPAYFNTEQFCQSDYQIKSDAAAIFVFAGKKEGLLDFEGKVILKPEFDDIVIFHQKNTTYISAKKNGKMGLYDRSGREIFPAQYDLFTLNIDESFSSSGRKNDPLCNGLAQMEKNDLKGLFDEQMRIVIPPEFTKIEYFRSGLFLVYRGEACGVYRYDGRIIIPVKEKRKIENLDAGRLLACDDYSANSIFDMDGNLIYSDAKLPEGERLIPGSFYSGLSKLGDEREGCAFVDVNGKTIRFDKYSFVSQFKDGSAVAETSGGKYGLIDATGKVLLPAEYTDIDGPRDSGYVFIEKDEKIGCAERATGKVILGAEYSRVVPDKQGNFFLFITPGEDQRAGAVDKNGKVIVKPEYSSITPSGDGKYLMCCNGDVSSAFDINGNLVIPAFKGSITLVSREGFWPVRIDSEKSSRLIDASGKTLFEIKSSQ